MKKKWKAGSGREWLKAKTQDVHLPACRQVEVRFIEVKGRAGVGPVALSESENEYHTAERLKNDFWLYAVFNCAGTPGLHTIQNPARLGWQPIVKVEHYQLSPDTILAARQDKD